MKLVFRNVNCMFTGNIFLDHTFELDIGSTPFQLLQGTFFFTKYEPEITPYLGTFHAVLNNTSSNVLLVESKCHQKFAKNTNNDKEYRPEIIFLSYENLSSNMKKIKNIQVESSHIKLFVNVPVLFKYSLIDIFQLLQYLLFI